jgi:two-component system NtrC family sensor kinase
MLIASFLVLTLIPLLLVTYLSYESSRKALYQSITKNFLQITMDKAATIRHWIFERITDAEVISKTPWITEIVQFPQKRRILESFLTLVMESYGCYEEIFILDKKGNYVVGTGLVKENLKDRDYFRNAIKGSTFVTDVRKAETTGVPTMFVSHPIRNKNNKIIGVLIERIKLDLLSKIMKEIETGETVESYLLNKEGYFITESKFEPNAVLRKKVSSEGYKNCLKDKKGVGKYLDYRRKPVLGSYLFIPETEWCLLTEQDVSEAFHNITMLKVTTTIIYLIIMVLVIVVSLLMSQKIIKILKKRDAELDSHMKELLKAEKLIAAGKLAAGIAHEIGNPLAGISNCAKLIRRNLPEKDSQISKYLSSIENEVERSSKTIRNFLNFTRETELRFEMVDINSIIEDTLLLIIPQASSQKVTVTKELNHVSRIRGDRIQLKQVFTNIILNSLGAMSGGGKLHIKSEEIDARIKVTFSDTGVGIEEKNLRKIFEPFFTTKRNGTGLGLSVVYKIIDKHNGSIEVKSDVGKGTEFIIRLPLQSKKK